MNKTKSPGRWATDLSVIWTKAMGFARFPVDVARLAQEYSRQVFPDAPITRVVSKPFQGFEGALVRRPDKPGEWGIAYASSLQPRGRINFTVAHEFGHYLLHRKQFPDGLKCRPEDMAGWDSDYNRVEAEANRFAAGLLMPYDDFRTRISPIERPELDDLGMCAKRYGVSLLAAALRWLNYTQKRAILVVSRDGFILWSRSSEPAFRSGTYIKVAGYAPKEIPPTSLAAIRAGTIGLTKPASHPENIWLPEPVSEQSMISERHDISVSLLMLEELQPPPEPDEEPVEDTVDAISRLIP